MYIVFNFLTVKKNIFEFDYPQTSTPRCQKLKIMKKIPLRRPKGQSQKSQNFEIKNNSKVTRQARGPRFALVLLVFRP